MSKAKKFFQGLPLACGVDRDLAKAYRAHIGKLYALEMRDPKSALRGKPGQTIEKRLAPAFAGWEDLADKKKVAFAKRLGHFLARSHGFYFHGVGDIVELSAERQSLEADAKDYPEVTKLLSVSTAARGQWG